MKGERHPPSLDVGEGSCTHVGMVLSVNGDAVLHANGSRKGLFDRLWAVADGMGGHQDGRLASRLACCGLRMYFAKSTENGGTPSVRALDRRLTEAVLRVDRLVLRKGSVRPSLAHMGTTLSCLLLSSGHSIIDGKWVLIERIGKGGMGEVHRAHQLNLKRDVALKLISREFLLDLEDNPEEVEMLHARFQREVQVMAQVRHPNVLQIFDYGSVKPPDDGAAPVAYIAIELIPGNTLRFTMSEEGLAGEEDLIREWIETYFLPVRDGVEAIHTHGIVHRDLKPENVLMDGETPKITGFGLSRSVRMRAVSNSWDVKGTWPYMAPEQFSEFRRAGVTADIYSLGKILYEAVTRTMDPKQLPFKAVGLEDPQTPLEQALDPIIRITKQRQRASISPRGYPKDPRPFRNAAGRMTAQIHPRPSPRQECLRRKSPFPYNAALVSQIDSSPVTPS